MDTVEKEIDKVRDQLADINSELTVLRKQGVNVDHAWRLTMNIPAKIQYAVATQSQEDVAAVTVLLQDIHAEINLAKNYSDEQTATELNDRVDTIMDVAPTLVKYGEVSKLKQLYERLREIYGIMPKEHRKETYKKCVELNTMIQQATQVEKQRNPADEKSPKQDVAV